MTKSVFKVFIGRRYVAWFRTYAAASAYTKQVNSFADYDTVDFAYIVHDAKD